MFRESANSAIMRLYLLDQFVDEMIKHADQLRSGEKLWMDCAFENEVVRLARETKQAFDRLVYRDALKFGFFDFATARDLYRNLSGAEGMHKNSIMKWIETQAVILSPIAPHLAEHIWTVKLKKPSLVVNQPWPEIETNYEPVLHREFELLFSSLEDFRKVKEKTVTSLKKQKGATAETTTAAASPDSSVIYIAKDYLPWQQTVLKILQGVPLDENKHAPLDPGFMTLVKSHPDLQQLDKKLAKEVMSFASFRMRVRRSL